MNLPHDRGSTNGLPHQDLRAATLATLAAVILLLAGCSKPLSRVDDANPAEVAKTNPWKTAASRLKKETDLAATKVVLATLSADVEHSTGQRLPVLSAEALQEVAQLIPLSPEDREEIAAEVFTPFDSAYLADCFYLRDAAIALALSGLPAEKQAELAFAWVCRQVYLHPWLQPVGPQQFLVHTLPPTAVLRRGFGSGLERMYVFLALLQQLELDGCLIGPSDPGPSTLIYEVTTPIKSLSDYEAAVAAAPRGPFWAVGVRIDNDVKLFDPWRGVVFPLTLNQLKANPEAAKAWAQDAAHRPRVTLDELNHPTVYLAVPVNSLSARMGEFERQLHSELHVKVAYDLSALRAKQAAFGNWQPRFWNPVGDPSAYGRVARTFLPVELGGADRAPAGGRLYDLYIREQIPASAFGQPAGLEEGLAIDRLRGAAAGKLYQSFIEPPNPRERIQRGQFQTAASDVVAKQQMYSNGLERLRAQNPAQQAQIINEWIATTNELYNELRRSRFNNDKDAEARVQAQIDKHWSQPGAILLIDRASAEVGRAEASLLLALCKHEQAERLQARLEQTTGSDRERLQADALDAWRTALAAWRSYEQLSSAHAGFPNRAAHARQLSARAAAFVEPKKLPKTDEKPNPK
ncbi:MAG: hypothetical protein RMJ56_08030 [Gemmataceae bacterium]|nr:hypothetical protein [Gemmata sp.]MDW8197538.1 hypothetical protein [Gemmataceae bacterium]